MYSVEIAIGLDGFFKIFFQDVDSHGDNIWRVLASADRH